jgi:leader peptidase (prepilin peptidase) / N-methyltransferase
MAIVTVLVEAYLVLFGLLAGSFINLAADRLPRGESVVHPRSHCRACGRELNALDLVPVLSYVVRRGRCASCHARIGPASPFVEAMTGALMLVPLLSLGLWPGAPIGLALIATWGIGLTILSARWFAGGQAR